MASKSLEDLGLKPDTLPTAGQDLADLPEFGTWEPPPQPGPFRFKLPGDLRPIYDVFDATDKNPPERVKMTFDREHPLLIVQSLGGRYNGQPFETRITNNERNRGKKGSGVVASDWDYLLRALGVPKGADGKVRKPASNQGYIEALRSCAGKEFGADLRYSWRCGQDGAGATQVVEGTRGCGAGFYAEDVPKNPDGTTPYEITCTCGALLRAFANLDNIRA